MGRFHLVDFKLALERLMRVFFAHGRYLMG
jgi:hypothetical protein